MALDTNLTRESILEHVGLLELRLTNHGTKTIIRDEKIINTTNSDHLNYIQHATHTYTIQGEDYKGTLKDHIVRGTSLLHPDHESQRAFRNMKIEQEDKIVFLAERILGGYDKKPNNRRPILFPKEPTPWKINNIGFYQSAMDTLLHLEAALSEFQNQLRYKPY